MARKEELGQDSEGRYRRSLGWKEGNGDKTIQHLFRLGRNREEAAQRNRRLETLWECVVQVWQRSNPETRASCPLWSDTTLAVGQAIARGDKACVLEPPPGVEPLAAVGWLATVQGHYPVLPLRLPDGVLTAGATSLRAEVASSEEAADVSRIVAGQLLARVGADGLPEVETLHKALDAYEVYIRQQYAGKRSLRHYLQRLGLLRRHHDNSGLGKVTADGLDNLLQYWRKRPVGKDGQPLARDTVTMVLASLRRFLRWLDRSEAFRWKLPQGYTFPQCKLDQSPADHAAKLERKHFKISELLTLWKYARPYERALMLLALNCGFGRGECATLQTAEIVQGKRHAYIKRCRRKTGVYAEWVLWPETVRALEYLAKSRPAESVYILASKDGRPLAVPTKSGLDSPLIRNHWWRLLRRLRKDQPDFWQGSYNKLRKTGATLVRRMASGELASLYLGHGHTNDTRDALLGVYAGRPWRKLHKALLRMRQKLEPVFAAVADPWGKPARTSPVVIEKVKALRALGRTWREIAAETGLCAVTCRRLSARE